MKGKILGAGAISGEDGVRYYYDEKELKNLKEGQKLEGCEVDFDIKDGKAVGVYIVKGGGFNADFGKVGANVSASLKNANLPSFDSKFVFWDLNEAKANILGANIHSAKFFMVLSMFCTLFGWALSFMNFLAYVFMLWGLLYFSKLSGSYKLLKYPLFMFVLSIVMAGVSYYAMKDMSGLNVWLGSASTPEVPYVKLLFIAILGVLVIWFSFLWFKTLYTSTNEKFFLWSFGAVIVFYILLILSFYPSISSMIEVASKTKAAIEGSISNRELAAMYESGATLEPEKYTIPMMGVVLAFIGLFTYATLKFREIRQIA